MLDNNAKGEKMEKVKNGRPGMKNFVIGALLALLFFGTALAQSQLKSELDAEMKNIRSEVTSIGQQVETLFKKRAVLKLQNGLTLEFARSFSRDMRKKLGSMRAVLARYQRLKKSIVDARIDKETSYHFYLGYMQICSVLKGFVQVVGGGTAQGDCTDEIQPPECNAALCEECFQRPASGNVQAEGIEELARIDCSVEVLFCQVISAASAAVSGTANVTYDDTDGYVNWGSKDDD